MSGFRRSLMKMAGGGRLPAGLQEVEYLESADGDQYLFPLIPNSFGYPNNAYMGDTRAYVEFDTPNGWVSSPIFGCRRAYNMQAFYICANDTGRVPWDKVLYFNYDSSYKDPMPNIGVDFTQRTALEINQNHITVNGTSYDSYYNYTKRSFVAYGDFGIFVCHQPPSTLYKACAGTRIYYFEIDNELSNDHLKLIPCYTTDDSWHNELGNPIPAGTKGMYDLVNGILSTNRGTDDFIAGPNV